MLTYINNIGSLNTNYVKREQPNKSDHTFAVSNQLILTKMKKSIVSLFMAAALICGSSVMAQTSSAKTASKAKTEVKADAKKAPAKKKAVKKTKKAVVAKKATKAPATK
jgi:hypothetical protein